MTNPENVTRFTADVDQSSFNAAKKELEQLKKVQEQIAQAALRGSKSYDQAGKELKQLTQIERDLEKVLKAANVELTEQSAKARRLSDDFDEVSRNVGLAGDVQSNLGALGALAPGEIGGAISGAGEVAALVEELPRLKTALSGLPQTVLNAVQALGPVGLGVAAAIAAAGVALAAFADESQKRADQINAIVDAQRQIGQDIAAGLTSDEASQRLETLRKQRDAEQKQLDELNNTYQEFEKDSGALAPVLKAVSYEEEALSEQIKKSKDNTAAFNAEIDQLEQALAEGELAANDAAEAEKQLALERADAALAAADAAGKQLQAEQRAINATAEQNQQRLSAIENEKAVVQKQIEVLQASGDTSEKVTDKLAALQQQLGALGDESQFITSNALDAATAQDKQKEATKAQEEASKAAQQAIDRANAAQANYTAAVSNAKNKLKQAGEDIKTGLNDTFRDIATKARDSLAKLLTDARDQRIEDQIESFREAQKSARDHYRELKSIRDNALQSEEDAVRNRDFLALREIERQQKRELDKANEQQTVEEQERAIAEREQREDRNRELDRQRRDLQIALGQQRRDAIVAANDRIRDANTAYKRELEQAQEVKKRELELAREAASKKLDIEQQYAQASISLVQQMLNAVNGGGASAGAPVSNSSSTTNNNVAFNISGGDANLQNQIIDTVTQLGLA